MNVKSPAISVAIVAGLQVPVTGVVLLDTSGKSGAGEF